MIKKNIEQYLEKIKEEVRYCEDSSFTGKIEFEVNMKQGSIGNMNIRVAQSFKLDR